MTVRPEPGSEPPMTTCPDCNGSGQEAIGEHFASREMAMDGGDPALEGTSMGIEYGWCSTCGGAGVLKDEAAMDDARMEIARAEIDAAIQAEGETR